MDCQACVEVADVLDNPPFRIRSPVFFLQQFVGGGVWGFLFAEEVIY